MNRFRLILRNVNLALRTASLRRAADRYGPKFDRSWYLARNRDIRELRLDPLQHYLLFGRGEGRTANPRILAQVIPRHPSPAFEDELKTQIAVIASSGVFDADWYGSRYGVRDEPIRHYIVEGAYEGLDPNPFFCTANYYAENADVARSGTNALFHYIAAGYDEGRSGALRVRHVSQLALNEKAWAHGIKGGGKDNVTRRISPQP